MTAFDDDEFSELVDANLPRVDLVGKGANGLPFLVAKSQMTPADVRSLLAAASSRKERPVTPYRYKHRGLVITSQRRLNLGEVRAVAAQHVAKASDTSAQPVPVYDATGNLVGTVDPAKINTFGEYPGSEPAKQDPMPDLNPRPADEAGTAATGVAKGARVSSAVAQVAKTLSLPGVPRNNFPQPSPESQARKEGLSHALDEIVGGMSGRYGLRDEEEREIAKGAVARVLSVSTPDVAEAAQALTRLHAEQAARAAIQRHRAQRR